MRILVSAAAAATSLALMIAAPAHAENQTIHAGHLLADAAGQLQGPTTIVVHDGRIVSVSPGLQPAEQDSVLIDLSDRTVLPGLIDAHVHLSDDPSGDFWAEAVEPDEWRVVIGAKNALITARAGFTTVRDVGSAPQVGFVLRRGTADGYIPGPRILSSGPPLSITGGHGDISGFRPEVNAVLNQGFTCTGADACAEKVRAASKAGSDLIKITATGGVLSQQARGLGQHFTDEEMKAIADTAHSLGLKVAAHAHGAAGIRAAAAAGIDSIEHCTFGDAAAIREMKAHGTVCVPTLMAYTGIRERLGMGVYTPQVEDKVRMTLQVVGKAAGEMHRQGVPIVFGTDAGVFEHGRNAEEFAMMTSLIGMTNREALAAATSEAAKLLDLEGEVGRIAPGYSADIIAVAENPLDNIRTLEKVGFVMVRGRVIP